MGNKGNYWNLELGAMKGNISERERSPVTAKSQKRCVFGCEMVSDINLL